jgi:hypothetical protein
LKIALIFLLCSSVVVCIVDHAAVVILINGLREQWLIFFSCWSCDILTDDIEDAWYTCFLAFQTSICDADVNFVAIAIFPANTVCMYTADLLIN